MSESIIIHWNLHINIKILRWIRLSVDGTWVSRINEEDWREVLNDLQTLYWKSLREDCSLIERKYQSVFKYCKHVLNDKQTSSFITFWKCDQFTQSILKDCWNLTSFQTNLWKSLKDAAWLNLPTKSKRIEISDLRPSLKREENDWFAIKILKIGFWYLNLGLW